MIKINSLAANFRSVRCLFNRPKSRYSLLKLNQFRSSSSMQEFEKCYPRFKWNLTPDEISQRTSAAINKSRSLIDSIIQIPDANLTFESAIEPLARDEGEFELERNIISFLISVSTDSAVRDAATEANKKMSDFLIEMEMKVELYNIFKKVREKEKNLIGEKNRFLDKSLLYKKRSGLHLPKEVRDELESMYKKMNNMCIDFEKNMSEENVVLIFNLSDLDGMPPDFIASLEKDGEMYKVTLKYPHVLPILKQCKIVSTRQKVEKAFNSRCIDNNTTILEDLIPLRHKKAQMLGYKNHADFITEILMSKSSSAVQQFLTSLSSKLRDAQKKEMNRLLELKQKECQELGIDFDGKINPYDMSYYQRMVEEVDFNVDQNAIKMYFPFDFVTEKLLDMYQTLLSLKFEKVEKTHVWHPEVTVYSVHCNISKELLGHFYLDLFPRQGKYTHAACFGLQSAVRVKDGFRKSCAAMVANFTKPLPDKPSLLTHDEVETYFHEFGHVMHQICSQTEYTMFHGTSVERDFVEAPSQMLENWVWEKESLKSISKHYETGQPLSDDTIAKLIHSRKANISLFYMRQIALSMFDFTIHTRSSANTFEIIQECWRNYIGYDPTPGTNFSAAFGHMCGGYDAQYYGYLWSQVFSCDMFVSRFKKEGIFNPKTGMDYRKMILYPGSTKDASEMLHQFLGRDPIQEPFLQIAGIMKQ